MSSPATDPIGGKPAPAASPARPKIRAGRAASALGLLFLFGNIFLWPIFYVIGLVSDLVRARGILFPIGFRARRKHFWNVFLLYLFLGFVLFGMICAAADEKDISRITATVLMSVLGAALAGSLLAVSVSRLHDRDLSGWWIFFYCGIPAAAVATLARGNPADWEFGVFGTVITVFVPWAIFALGFRAGTIGPNRFGEESPWFNTRRRRVSAAPSPAGQSSAAAQPAPRGPSAAATPAPAPANPIPAAAIQAPAAATHAQAIAVQAPAAAVVSSPAEVQPAQMSAAAAPADRRGRIREFIGDLISVNGRMDPGRYWICTVIQCAYALLAWLVIHLVTGDRDISQHAYWISVGVIAFLPAALSMIASGMKRLHDRDLSGWWLPGFLILFVVILEVTFLIFDQQFVMDGSFIFAIWVVAIWQFSRLPGTVGPNRFGPDPLD
jgi:uncharacterized membrane protein YhaH (DUF805 family)